MVEITLWTALLAGLFGGVHCAGMCGPIVATIGITLPVATKPQHNWLLILLYNLGRISSYVLAGAVMGAIGGVLLTMTDMHQLRQIMLLLVGLFMLLLGLYISGWWQGLVVVERWGGMVVWQRIQSYAAKLLPVTTPKQAWLAGMVWGWLPCGLVYSALIWALLIGNTLNGALLLLAFGLGTLPNLLLMGLFSSQLAPWFRQPAVRRWAGVLIMAMGVWYLWQGM